MQIQLHGQNLKHETLLDTLIVKIVNCIAFLLGHNNMFDTVSHISCSRVWSASKHFQHGYHVFISHRSNVTFSDPFRTKISFSGLRDSAPSPDFAIVRNAHPFKMLFHHLKGHYRRQWKTLHNTSYDTQQSSNWKQPFMTAHTQRSAILCFRELHSISSGMHLRLKNFWSFSIYISTIQISNWDCWDFPQPATANRTCGLLEFPHSYIHLTHTFG